MQCSCVHVNQHFYVHDVAFVAIQIVAVYCLLISDVVRLSGTYLILLIRIRLYLCRLDYIFYCTYRLRYPYCPSTLGRLIVLSLLFSLGTFLLFPMDYCLVLQQTVQTQPLEHSVEYNNNQQRYALLCIDYCQIQQYIPALLCIVEM